MYAVVLPAVTASTIPGASPQACVIRIGWGALSFIGLALLIIYKPREKYHYVNRRHDDE